MSKPVVLAAAAAAAAYYLYKNKKEDEPEEVVRVSHAEALEKTTAALKAVGWDDEGARVQASIMVSSEACGNNQGLVKMFKPELMAPAPGAGKPVVERETASSAVIKGNQSPGMLALTKAVDLACAKAKGGVASVGVYDTSTSSGQLAFYGARAAEKGRIVIITANSPEFVAAKAGAKASFGTNPLCFACPVEGRSPFVFDMSTAAIALFGVLTCKAKGQPLPQNSAYDANGNWTRKVEDIHIGGGGGAIANFGGHKGTGLALMVELLCAALAGGAVLGKDLCGIKFGRPTPSSRRVSVAASARWRGDSTPSTRCCRRDRVGSMAWRFTKVHAISTQAPLIERAASRAAAGTRGLESGARTSKSRATASRSATSMMRPTPRGPTTRRGRSGRP